MDVDLFIKRVPRVVKDLISREAFENRRSINQEAIALLQEALLKRAGATASRRGQIEAALLGYASHDGRMPTVPDTAPAEALRPSAERVN